MSLYSRLESFLPQFGWRRMWMLSREKIGFTTKGFFLLYGFLLHLGMAIAGMFVGLAGILAWPFGIKLGDVPLPVCFILVPIGGIFTAVLGVLILGRKSVVMDRARGELKETVGLRLLFLPMLPLASKRSPLTDFSAVRLQVETRHNQKSSYEVHTVSLVRKNGLNALVMDALNELAGRNIAEDVARFAGLPMEDKTGAESVTRPPELLDEPLAEQARRTSEADFEHAPPQSLLAEYAQEGPQTVVRIKRPPFRVARPSPHCWLARCWARWRFISCRAIHKNRPGHRPSKLRSNLRKNPLYGPTASSWPRTGSCMERALLAWAARPSRCWFCWCWK